MRVQGQGVAGESEEERGARGEQVCVCVYVGQGTSAREMVGSRERAGWKEREGMDYQGMAWRDCLCGGGGGGGPRGGLANAIPLPCVYERVGTLRATPQVSGGGGNGGRPLRFRGDLNAD